MHVLVNDDRGGLILCRLWPWQRVLAQHATARLDRALAAGTRPEASAGLAARATRLTSTGFRRDLAASLRRILVAAGEPALPVAARSPLGVARSPLGVARPLRVPLRSARISQSAPLLADLASRLLEPGPVPVAGVAMVTELLADGTGPLYRDAADDDLAVLATQAAVALTW
jgi:hypothetical protein